VTVQKVELVALPVLLVVLVALPLISTTTRASRRRLAALVVEAAIDLGWLTRDVSGHLRVPMNTWVGLAFIFGFALLGEALLSHLPADVARHLLAAREAAR